MCLRFFSLRMQQDFRILGDFSLIYEIRGDMILKLAYIAIYLYIFANLAKIN